MQWTCIAFCCWSQSPDTETTMDLQARTHRGLGEGVRTNRPTSVGGPLLPLSKDQYAIFAADVEAVTAEELVWVPRSSKRKYILHLKQLFTFGTKYINQHSLFAACHS